MTRVLVIDDEEQIRTLLSRILALEGYEVSQADSLAAAKRQMSLRCPDIVLCDVFLPDGNGVDAIPALKSLIPNGIIIMLTAHGNISDGVRAIKAGGYDYLTKGDDNDRIIPLMAEAADRIALRKKEKKQESALNKDYSFDAIIGSSKPLLDAVNLARKVSVTDTTVLLTGETGTGKEVFASAIQKAGKRSAGAFVAVNCGALSKDLMESELFGYRAGAFTGAIRDKKGLFDQVDGGTIFLDEIGEMPSELQVKMLRVLESGSFIPVGDTEARSADVRIIAATNRDLADMVKAGSFREDLFYRLTTFTIELPPLRERGEDIVLLAKSFIAAFAVKMDKPVSSIDEAFLEILRHYSWPGNIRELRNIIERSMILSDEGNLTAKDLPLELQISQDAVMDRFELASIEKSHICRMLQYTAGNKTEAARLMKIGLTTLYRKIEEYGIKQ